MQPYETLTETEWTQVERIHDLIDEGELEEARTALETLARRRPGHPDLRVVDATIALEEGEPAAALAALQGAERSADPAQFFFLRAAALYDLVRFDEARADADRAIAVHPDFAHAHDLRSRILDHLGDEEGAANAAEEAASLDADAFPLPLPVADEDFDALVGRAVEELPAPIRRKLEELPVIVQALPTREMLTGDEPPLTPDLLGLFVGPHIFARHPGAPAGAPGAIFLFRKNLLRACADKDELAREVRITVQHEVGHLMGLDEDELEDWGLG